LNELIEKIKTQINAILDIKVGDTTVKGSLSQIDSRASAIPIAALITVFLFLVMQALVSSNEFDLGEETASINISFLRQLQDTETQTAKKKPNRPEQEQEPDPPEMDIPETPRPEMSSESVSTPDFGGPQFGAFSASTDADVLPIVKVPPQYPRRATQRGIEGWVLVEFTITETGAVINPIVIDADPPGIFNRSAMRTIVKWKYKPRIVGGKAVPRPGVQHLITYELEDAR
jgi:protein TonB|tara:strand:- start:1 stop:693 length:693 start_codon:yes stop_codon:yes gene_type:complete